MSPLVLAATRFAEPPRIDGILDEPAWATAAATTGGFTQFFPVQGDPATHATVVHVGYDATTLYLGVRCDEPERLIARALREDSDLANDDRIEVHLDTFHDRTNAFLFVTNPYGAKTDGTVRADGEEVRWDWDGVWAVETSRDAGGWTVELAIPFSTLRFEGDAPTFGLQIGRFVSRAQELSFWAPMANDSGLATAAYRVSRYGELDGLSGVEAGGRVEVRPYVSLGAASRGDEPLGPVATGGGDVKIALTPSLVADLTANPDFSESEVPQLVTGVIGVNRFGVLLPEQRQFFREGADLFYVGDRPESFFEIPERFVMFDTRTVGLAADGVQPVPILGGARITGRAGPLSVAAMNLTTAAVDDPVTGLDEPLSNVSVLRAKTDLFGSSSVGVIGTDREDADGGYDRGAAADLNLQLGPALRVGGYAARTLASDAPVGDDWALNADALLQTAHLEVHAVATDIGENFRPELGFVTRSGMRKLQLSPIVILTPPGELNRIYLAANGDRVIGRDGELQSQLVQGEVFAPMASGHSLAVLITADREVFTEPFELYPGVVIPPGDYQLVSNLVVYGSDFDRPYGAIVWVDPGPFFGGFRFRTRLIGYLRPVRGVSLDVNWERQQVTVPVGAFVSNVVNSSLTVSPSRTLSVRGTFELASDDRLLGQGLLQWSYQPNAYLYLIYQEERDLRTVGDPRPWLDGRTLSLKWTSYWGS
ncbi:MAG: carbohydrate binding family 9 domain-containing protein [Myxococcota bacterium]